MTRSTLLGVTLAALVVGSTPALAQGDLRVSFTTAPKGGPYAPRNVIAVWIEDAGGSFVKTIGRWASERRQHLVAWATASGQDADAVSGATRSNHTGIVMAAWDLKNRAGAIVPDGTYTIRMELADSNANTAAQNHQGSFTFVKGPQSSTETTAATGFTGVTIDYAVGSATCNNGAIDAGETCDPPGSCPTSCAASADACMPNRLIGSAAGCTSECVTEAITACVSGDGCCASGCDLSTDTDCGPGGTGGDDDLVTGGCDAGSGPGSGVAIAWFLALGLALSRRRRPA